MIDGPNMYVYCGNDPVNLVDLWGLCKYLDGEIESFPWWQEVGVDMAALAAVRYGPGLALRAGFYGGWKTVLFSGTVGKELAKASLGTPIFRTFIGGAMDKFETIFNVHIPRVLWDVASSIYTSTARGTVQVFVTEPNFGYDSTFARIEAPIMAIKEALGIAEMIFK